VGEFLKTYVAGPTPIPYDTYFSKMGVTKIATKVPGNVFIKGQKPYITVNPNTKEIIVLPDTVLPDFYSVLGIKGSDILTAVNGKEYNLDNIYDMIMGSEGWKEDDAIEVKIKRDGKAMTLKGKIKLPYEDAETFKATDNSKEKLREAWLKG